MGFFKVKKSICLNDCAEPGNEKCEFKGMGNWVKWTFITKPLLNVYKHVYTIHNWFSDNEYNYSILLNLILLNKSFLHNKQKNNPCKYQRQHLNEILKDRQILRFIKHIPFWSIKLHRYLKEIKNHINRYQPPNKPLNLVFSFLKPLDLTLIPELLKHLHHTLTIIIINWVNYNNPFIYLIV